MKKTLYLLGQLAYSMQSCFIKKSHVFFSYLQGQSVRVQPQMGDGYVPGSKLPNQSTSALTIGNCDYYPIQQIREKFSIVMCYLPGRFRFRTSRRRLSRSNSRPGGFWFLHSIFSKERYLISYRTTDSQSRPLFFVAFKCLKNRLGL